MSGARGLSRVATNGRVPVVAGGAGRRGAATRTTKDPKRGDAELRPDGYRPVAGDKRPRARSPVGPSARSPRPLRGSAAEPLGVLSSLCLGAGPGRTCQVSAPPVPLAH